MYASIGVNRLKELAVGDDHPTIISFDLALYDKVVQLLDSRPDLQVHFVPRMGELHIVMASLIALGTSIENSGIDDAWIEADVYGSATTRQILQCKHYKRSLRAHIYTYVRPVGRGSHAGVRILRRNKPHLLLFPL